MRNKKQTILICIAAVVIVAFVVAAVLLFTPRQTDVFTVGFIYDNAEETPYSYSFMMAQEAVEEEFQGKVRVMMFSNIMQDSVDEPLRVLVENDCDLVFTNGYGDFRTLARLHPDIEFCQVSNTPYPAEEASDNYHTFKGEIYQGRYASGVVAGMKLRQLIETGDITPEEAKVGYVAAYPEDEVISGYSAFLLGVRSIVPEATMTVRYIYTWDSYTKEKQCADRLLNEGCIIISQHSDTVGPAVACEEYLKHPAFHVGYNVDMTDVAPHASLVSTRIEWTPYIVEATRAAMAGKNIEEEVDGRIHPLNDLSAGFERDWVRLTELNEKILPPGTKEAVDRLIADFTKGSVEVFKGPYTGVNPKDSEDRVNLEDGFVENRDSSIPAFHYILDGIVTVEN